MEHLNNLPPFYVGQKVVAICNHSSGLIKGETYTIIDIKKSFCGCSDWDVDVGFTPKGNLTECNFCGEDYPRQTKGRAISSKRFRPLQEQTFPLITMKKVLEEQLVCSN